MSGFVVNLNITDTLICNNCRNTITKDVTITSTAQTVLLQDNYILNVVFANSSRTTVLIQNGTNVIIRNIYTNYETRICLPSKCCRHILSLKSTNTEV